MNDLISRFGDPLMRLSFLLPVIIGTALSAQESAVNIELADNTEREAATRTQLLRLLEQHDVDRWIFTPEILIDQTQIPHSHPVLTLHTRHLDNDLELMSTFIHEQYHWFVSARDDREQAAVEAFREIFPDAPGREGQGARDQYSTYLHLIVCDMEFQGMTTLFGEEAAREILGAMTHYQWIYTRVLNDPRIREINERMGFIVP